MLILWSHWSHINLRINRRAKDLVKECQTKAEIVSENSFYKKCGVFFCCCLFCCFGVFFLSQNICAALFSLLCPEICQYFHIYIHTSIYSLILQWKPSSLQENIILLIISGIREKGQVWWLVGNSLVVMLTYLTIGGILKHAGKSLCWISDSAILHFFLNERGKDKKYYAELRRRDMKVKLFTFA